VLGDVAPLLVGERAEGLVDRAQVLLQLLDGREAARVAQVGADALQRDAGQRAPKSLRIRRRIGLPGSAAISMPIWPPSEVPIQSTCSAPLRAITAAVAAR
jgi:hypothetical protein